MIAAISAVLVAFPGKQPEIFLSFLLRCRTHQERSSHSVQSGLARIIREGDEGTPSREFFEERQGKKEAERRREESPGSIFR
jgi:hypothetical protein